MADKALHLPAVEAPSPAADDGGVGRAAGTDGLWKNSECPTSNTQRPMSKEQRMNARGKEDCGQHGLASNPWHVNGEETANVQHR